MSGQGNAYPEEFPADQARIELLPDGEPWPPMTDAELDAAWQQEHAHRTAPEFTVLAHVHDICGHRCVHPCRPADRICIYCELDLQDSREPRRSYGIKRGA